MSPSTKCGQFGSEGHILLAFICGHGSSQHSSCLYLRTTWALGAWRKQSLTGSMHITVVTCGRSSVSAGHTVSQTTHSTDVLIPAPLMPLSALLDGACSDIPPTATRRPSPARYRCLPGRHRHPQVQSPPPLYAADDTRRVPTTQWTSAA